MAGVTTEPAAIEGPVVITLEFTDITTIAPDPEGNKTVTFAPLNGVDAVIESTTTSIKATYTLADGLAADANLNATFSFTADGTSETPTPVKLSITKDAKDIAEPVTGTYTYIIPPAIDNTIVATLTDVKEYAANSQVNGTATISRADFVDADGNTQTPQNVPGSIILTIELLDNSKMVADSLTAENIGDIPATITVDGTKSYIKYVFNEGIPLDANFVSKFNFNTTAEAEGTTIPVNVKMYNNDGATVIAKVEGQEYTFGKPDAIDPTLTSTIKETGTYEAATEVSGTISLTRAEATVDGATVQPAAIAGPLTLKLELSDNSVISGNFTAPEILGVTGTLSKSGTTSTITYNLPDGIAADANLVDAAYSYTTLATAKGKTNTIKLTITNADGVNVVPPQTVDHTFTRPEVIDPTVKFEVSGYGTYMAGQDVDAYFSIKRERAVVDGKTYNPANIDGPMVYTVTWEDLSAIKKDDQGNYLVTMPDVYGAKAVLDTSNTDPNKLVYVYTIEDGIPYNENSIKKATFTSIAQDPQPVKMSASLTYPSGKEIAPSQAGEFLFNSNDNTIELLFNPTPAEDRHRYSGEQDLIKLKVTKTAGSPIVEEARIIIMFYDPTYLNDKKLSGSDLSSAYAKEFVKDPITGKNVGLMYSLRALNPGVELEIPVTYTTVIYDTPHNTPMPYKAYVAKAVTNPDTGVEEIIPITNSVASHTTFDLKEPTFFKTVRNTSGAYQYSTDNQTVFGGVDGVYNALGELETPEDGIIDSPADVAHYFYISNKAVTGIDSSYGIRRFSDFTVTDTIPEGAFFDPAKNPGWVEIEPGVVQFTRNNSNNSNYGTSFLQSETNINLKLVLNYPNYNVGLNKENEKVTNTAKVKLTPKDGTEDETNNFFAELEDSITYKLSTTVIKGAVAKSPDGTTLADQTLEKEKEQTWTLQIGNTDANWNITKAVITDTNLDIYSNNQVSRMYYTGAALSTTYIKSIVNPDGSIANITITAYDANGNIVNQVTKAGDDSTRVDYAEGNNITKITFSVDGDGAILPSKYFQVKVYSKFIDPEAITYNATNSSANLFCNTGLFNYEWSELPNVKVSGSDIGYYRLVEYKPQIYMAKEMYNDATSAALSSAENTGVLVNNIIRTNIVLTEAFYGNLLDPDTINDLRIVDLLPEYTEYVEGSSTFGGTPSDNIYAVVNAEPQAISNYKNTGKTALVWDFNTIIGDYTSSYGSNNMLRITYKFNTTNLTPPDVNTNEAFAIWSNNKTGVLDGIQQVEYTGIKQDIYDIDGNGDSTENVLYAKDDFFFIPPAELITFKTVQGNLDSKYVPTGGLINIGQHGTYQVTVLNKSNSPSTNLTLIDVLPYVGDVGIVPVKGQYRPRGSAYPIGLSGNIITPDGSAVPGAPTGAPAETYKFSVYYSASVPNGTDPGVFAASADWSATWQTARSMKIVMEQGTIWPQQSVSFTLPVVAPLNTTLQTGDKANNTAASSGDPTASIFTEASASSMEIFNFMVTGYTFGDYNQDGRRDTVNDGVIPNAEVELWTMDNGVAKPVYKILADGDGNPILDATGNIQYTDEIVKAKTDDKGYYELQTHFAGEYFVKFKTPGRVVGGVNIDYTPTTQIADAILTSFASHIGEEQNGYASTDVFTLDGSNLSAVRNAGYVYKNSDIKITKALRTVLGANVAQNNRDFTYKIEISEKNQDGTYGDFVPFVGDAVINRYDATLKKWVNDSISVTDGLITMKNGQSALAKGMLRDSKYKVTEILDVEEETVEKLPVYDAKPLVHQGTLTRSEITLPFVNQEKDNGVITVNKILKDSTGKIIEKGTDPLDRTFYFRLYTGTANAPYNGTSTSGGLTFTLKAGESKQITGLRYTYYYLYEYTDDTYTTQLPNGVDYYKSLSYANSYSSAFGYKVITYSNRVSTMDAINTEAAKGVVNINKLIFGTDGKLLDPQPVRNIQYKITGPSYPAGTIVWLNNTDYTQQPYVSKLSNLKYGEYTIQEHTYNVLEEMYETGTVDESNAFVADGEFRKEHKINVSFDKREASFTFANKEKPAGAIWVYKQTYNAAGSRKTSPYKYTIELYKDKNGEPIATQEIDAASYGGETAVAKFTDLEYGKYYVKEGPTFNFDGDTVNVDDVYDVKYVSNLNTSYVVNTDGRESFAEVDVRFYPSPNNHVNRPLISVNNTEKDAGQIDLKKHLLANMNSQYPNPGPGDLLTGTDYGPFKVQVKGPVQANGVAYDETFSLTPGVELSAEDKAKLSKLRFGNYSIVEIDPATNTTDYERIQHTTAAGLTPIKPKAEAIILNRLNNIGKITISKEYVNSLGQVVAANTMKLPANVVFDVKVTGPSYPFGQIFQIRPDRPAILSNLIYGEYTIEEVFNDEYQARHYDVSYRDGNGTVTSGPVKITVGFKEKEKTLTVVNKEKDLGTLYLGKLLLKNFDFTIQTNVDNEQDKIISEQRTFKYKLTGPSYPTGQVFEVKNAKTWAEFIDIANAVEIKNLKFGSYTLEEVEHDDYRVFNPLGFAMNSPYESDKFNIFIGGVTAYNASNTIGSTPHFIMDIDVKMQMYFFNMEKALGKITINKEYQDSKGNKLDPANMGMGALVDFKVNVTGPSYPDGKEFHITPVNPVVIENLIYGDYTITEIFDTNSDIKDDFVVSYKDKNGVVTTNPVTLNVDIVNKENSAIVVNKEKDNGKLRLTKLLFKNTENSDIDTMVMFNNMISEERTFKYKVTGPSFPTGKIFDIKNVPNLEILQDIANYDTNFLRQDNLIYGEYTIEEIGADDYTVVNSFGQQYGGHPMFSNVYKVFIGTNYSFYARDYNKIGTTIDVVPPGTILTYFYNLEKDLGEITVNKNLLKSDGKTKITEARTFEVTVTGPKEYNKTFTLTNGTPLVIDKLYYGEYTVTETRDTNNYNTEVNEYKVTVSNASKKASVTFTNKELDDAKLNVNIAVLTSDDKPVENGRKVKVTITGPSFPDGKEIEYTTGEPMPVFEGLIYGEYTISANDPNYNITYPAEKVTLDIKNKVGEVAAQFKEKDDGKLDVTVQVLDFNGDPVEKGRKVTVTVTGPNGYSKEIEYTTGTTIPTIEGLKYGEYTITANDPNYTITYPAQTAKIDIDNKLGEVETVFTEKPLGKITVSAEVNDADGNPVPAGRKVKVKLVGPSYPEGLEVEITTGEPFPVIEGLIYGEYKIVADDPNYDITLPDPVTVSIDNKEAELHTIFKERPLGELEVKAQVFDNAGNPVPNGRKVKVTVTGPSYPDGKVVEITTGQPFPILEGLKYGEYKVTADDPNYTITYPKESAKLDIDNKVGEVETVFTEKPLGKLTVGATVLDAQGKPITDGRIIKIKVYGPSYPDGHIISYPAGSPFPVLDNLIYGEYSTELVGDYGDYDVSLPTPVELSIDNKEGELVTVLKEKPLGELEVKVKVYDVNGKEVKPGTKVKVTVYGPSFPNGKVVEVITGEPFPVLTGLIYGEYSVVANDNNGQYSVELPSPVTLNIKHKTDELETIFREKPAASVLLGVEVFDADGKPVKTDAIFTVILYGPSFPNGMEFKVGAGMDNAIWVEGLQFGTYYVKLKYSHGYLVKLPSKITLTPYNRSGHLIVKLTEPELFKGFNVNLGDTVE